MPKVSLELKFEVQLFSGPENYTKRISFLMFCLAPEKSKLFLMPVRPNSSFITLHMPMLDLVYGASAYKARQA